MRRAAYAVIGAGGCWAMLCLLLAWHGHAPSRGAWGIARQHHYIAQALFVTPLLLVQWLVCTALVWRVLASRSRGAAGASLADGTTFASTAARLAPTLAWPLIWIVLVPDLIAYLALGFDGLGRIVRVTGPLCLVTGIALATRAMRALHGVSLWRASAASALGVIAQALLGGVLLR